MDIRSCLTCKWEPEWDCNGQGACLFPFPDVPPIVNCEGVERVETESGFSYRTDEFKFPIDDCKVYAPKETEE